MIHWQNGVHFTKIANLDYAKMFSCCPRKEEYQPASAGIGNKVLAKYKQQG